MLCQNARARGSTTDDHFCHYREIRVVILRKMLRSGIYYTRRGAKQALLKLGAAASSDGQLHFENIARQTAAFDAVGYITHLRPREWCWRSPRA